MNESPTGGGTSWRWVIVSLALILSGVGVLCFLPEMSAWSQRPTGKFDPRRTPFDGPRAYKHLQEICAIGPRVSGREGMRRQQAYLHKHFTELGGKVSLQEFTERDPQTGEQIALANMLVEWKPEARERILFCCHYDTRPFPDRDPNPARRRDKFLGANDGASGVALFCELGRHLAGAQSKYGVDFVFFDAEELVYDDTYRRDKYFIGSEYFARDYVAKPPAHKYRWGVLVDMIGDAQLQIFREQNSMSWIDTRPLVLDIWNTAREIGVAEFIHTTRHEVRDDHIPLHDIAGIPTCDIIDFDYPHPNGRVSYWHTTQDIPEHCSGESLAKVGAVLLAWLPRAK